MTEILKNLFFHYTAIFVEWIRIMKWRGGNLLHKPSIYKEVKGLAV